MFVFSLFWWTKYDNLLHQWGGGEGGSIGGHSLSLPVLSSPATLPAIR